jgi:NADPH-dependent 2,4-dienoyl-CoA reductase/sulfur reductase-like enzyme
VRCPQARTRTRRRPRRHAGKRVHYDRLAICTGARPALAASSPHVIGIRDTETVADLRARLGRSRRVLLLGNGGIAMEFVHAMRRSAVELVWAVKDNYIGNTFLDHSASAFIMPALFPERDPDVHGFVQPAGATSLPPPSDVTAASAKTVPVAQSAGDGKRAAVVGSSVGPTWAEALHANERANPSAHPNISIHFNCTLDGVEAPSEGAEWPVVVRLSSGARVPCDFVVSATGVVPNADFLGAQVETGGSRGCSRSD